MDIKTTVREILEDIEKNGFKAVENYSEKFDGYTGSLNLSEEEWESAEQVSERDRTVVERIAERLTDYHSRQLEKDDIYFKKDSVFGLVSRSIDRVGIYVPGGKPLPSTLLMTVIPAILAGVKDIVVCTPPKNGSINPLIIYIARKFGITELYKVGGVQAIAAMTYGAGFKSVNKIFGPGNAFVNEAKRQVYGDVGIDSLAGPSEICVIADSTATGSFIKEDLLSQREHGKDSKAWLLTTSEKLAEYCSDSSIDIEILETLEECAERANSIAPEHLEIVTEKPLKIVDLIRNAGAVYLGEYTPVPSADYFLGSNHVLPTGKAARFSSVLTVNDFQRRMTVASLSKEEFMADRDLGIRMAQIEGLEHHRKSMEVRE
ncbi:MAG TPA: histidinol dehydrogenase [Thermotogota bacterium]|nr:histidinol dehydrogenase [Thermotogota bacterium]HPR96974.1 histidinol dehydrogenase [Thermotogota bacterium]